MLPSVGIPSAPSHCHHLLPQSVLHCPPLQKPSQSQPPGMALSSLMPPPIPTTSTPTPQATTPRITLQAQLHQSGNISDESNNCKLIPYDPGGDSELRPLRQQQQSQSHQHPLFSFCLGREQHAPHARRCCRGAGGSAGAIWGFSLACSPSLPGLMHSVPAPPHPAFFSPPP
jgi:hypothetical protein